MGIVVLPADLAADRTAIIRFLREHLTPESNEERFEWLYLNCPLGFARAWLARDSKLDALIGVGAAFPRRMSVCGIVYSCWVLGDFCIREDYRSLGPALLLQRACLSIVENDNATFCYDYPGKGMMAIYRRLGVSAQGQWVRFAKPLRVDRMVRKIVHNDRLTKGISAAGNRLLGLRNHVHRSSPMTSVAFHQGRLDEEFTHLSQRLAARFRVCGHRTAEYLNWRFLDNPMTRCRILTARHGSELMAYAVISATNEEAVLLDLFGDSESGAVRDLLTALPETLRDEQISNLSFHSLDSNPWISSLLKMGFYRRESAPFVVHARPESPLSGAITDNRDWFLTQGDRDS